MYFDWFGCAHHKYAQYRQKGFAPVLILVGILVLATVAGGVYLFSQFQASKLQPPNPVVTSQTPSPTTSASSPVPNGTGETANWKTYTNKDLSFKYPSDWSVDDTVITATSPRVKIVIVSEDSTLMNECMEKIAEEIKNSLVVKKFARVITGAMCSTSDSTPREIWIVPSKDAYSPGISYGYSATESQQAEEIFDQILSTFRFD